MLTAPINSLLAFSTSPGTVAYDGTGANSPFTQALIETATANPDKPVGQIFEDVRRIVFERTGGKQVPWESSTLVQPAVFRLPDVAGDAATATEGGLGQGRGLVLLTMGQAAVAERVQSDAGIELAARREREVDIGAALVETMAVAPEAPVEIAEPPAHGRLLLRREDGLLEDATRVALTGADLGRLVYADARDPVPPPGRRQRPIPCASPPGAQPTPCSWRWRPIPATTRPATTSIPKASA